MTPIFLVVVGSTSTSIFTGSKQAVTMAIASGLVSVFSCSVTLASLHEAPNTTSTGRRLMAAAALACSRDGCHGTPASLIVAQQAAERQTAMAEKTMRLAVERVRRHMACGPSGKGRWKP